MKYNNVITYHSITTYVHPDSLSYYIEGICHNGSKHYSADMTYEDACAEMPKYNKTVELFGGGLVKLIEKPNKCIRFKYI